MKQLIFTLSIVLIFISCKPTEQIKTDTNYIKRYALGQGGGFTGDYSEFILAGDGKVYKYDFKYDREVYYKDLDKADLIYFMNKIETLGLEGIDINEPGNMSYYIEIRMNKTSLNKITWGKNLYYPPNNLVDFHQELFKKLSELD